MARSFKSWAAQNDDELRREEEDQEEEQNRPKSFKAWKQQSTTPDTPAAVPTATPSIPAPSTSAQRTGFKAWRQQNGTPIPEATAAEPKYSTMDRYRPGGVYRPEVAELQPEPETYAGTTSSIGRYRPSGMYKPETQEVQGAQPWDALYSSGAIARGQELAAKSTLSGEEKQEARALQREIDKVTKTRGTAKSDKYAELTDLSAKLYSKSNWFAGLSSGVIQALGFDWLTDRTADIVEAVTGVKSDTGAQELTASAQKNFPTWNAAGNVAGSVLELGAISSAVGGALSKAKWFANLAPWVQRATSSAITFGISGAAEGVTNIQSKEEWDKQEREQSELAASFGVERTPREYNIGQQLGKVGIGAATGAASGFLGSALSSAFGKGTSSILIRNGLQYNNALRAIAAGINGVGFAAGSTATQEISKYLQYPDGYQANPTEIGTNLAVAFLFSAASGAISEAKAAKANKDAMLKMMDELALEYESAKIKMAGMTGEARIAEAGKALELSKRIRTAIATSPGMSGVQEEVKALVAALDIIDDQMGAILAGGNGLLGAADIMSEAGAVSGEPLALAVRRIGANVPAPTGADAPTIQVSAPEAPSVPAWYEAYQNSLRQVYRPMQQRPALQLPAVPGAVEETRGNVVTAPQAPAAQNEAQAPVEDRNGSELPNGSGLVLPSAQEAPELTPEPERGIVEEKPAETPVLPEGTTDADIAEMNGVSKPLWNYTRRSSSPLFGIDFNSGKSYMGDGKAIVEVDHQAVSVAMQDRRYGGVGARHQDMTNILKYANRTINSSASNPLEEQPRVLKDENGEEYYIIDVWGGHLGAVGKDQARLIDGYKIIASGEEPNGGGYLVSVNEDGSIHGVTRYAKTSVSYADYKKLPKGKLNGITKAKKEKGVNNGPGEVDAGRPSVRGGKPGPGGPAKAGEKPEAGERVLGSGDIRHGDVQPDEGNAEQPGTRSGRSDDTLRPEQGGNAGHSGEADGQSVSGVAGESAGSAEPGLSVGADDGRGRVTKSKPRNRKNYRIAEDIDSTKPNYQDNIDAIKLMKELMETGRKATPEEMAVLAKYKGWGALKEILNEYSYWGRVLSKLVTPEEYNAAKLSTANAHYTSTKVINAMYDAVKRLGFTGGRVLEPSMGVGNFFGVMPDKLSRASELYGVELDSITGNIAKLLYPDAKIDVAGFQDVLYADDTFDLVIGNVPFSNDVRIPYRGNTYNLHDFFFVKALDETKPGGIAALITSTGTLDKTETKVRRAIAARANLIAAFRLPDDAFKTNAGTSVTTDLIFLQKRGNGIDDNGIAFETIGKLNDIPINEYYTQHPKNILGNLAYEKGMYPGERAVVHSNGEDMQQALSNAIKTLPKDIMNTSGEAARPVIMRKRGERKKATFVVRDDGSVEITDGTTGEVIEYGKATKKEREAAETIRDYVGLKNTFIDLLETEGRGENGTALRERLNTQYDSFVKKHGPLSDPANKKLLKPDGDYIRTTGIEVKTKDGYGKSDIFRVPTVSKLPKTHADSAEEALSITLNESGKVDIPRMAELTGKTQDEIKDELKDEIIQTPDGDWQLVAQYASGNIYEKLDRIGDKPEYDRHRRLLEAALPRPKGADEIDASFGAHWIAPEYVKQFIDSTFSINAKVQYNKELGQWTVEFKGWPSVKRFNTDRIDAKKIIESTLNGRNVVVKDKIDDKSVINEPETKLAQSKQDELREAFREWAFKDSKRAEDLMDTFNRSLNAYAPMNYDALANRIDFGVNPASTKQPRDYQKAAAARIVFGGNTLLHNGVGTGKTLTMAIAAHALKQAGIAQKPMFVVPNGKVEDFRSEILEAYPDAKILALDNDSMTPKQIQATKSLIATGDWDYVIIYRSAFELIPLSPERAADALQRQLDLYESAARDIAGDKNGNKRFEKGLAQRVETLRNKIQELLDKPKDTSTYFDDMGIDALFVDEAHNYKKVGFPTSMQVSGIVSDTNDITTDLYMKEEYLRDRGNRIVLASATPITNAISEMYNMTMHVAPEVYRNAGIYSFDAWANTFANIESQVEIAPDGKTFRRKERVRSYKNANELFGLYRQFADIKQTKDVVENLPKAEEITVISESDDLHKQIVDYLSNMPADRILQMNNDNRAAATDLRLVTELLKEMGLDPDTMDLDLPGSKINKAVNNIVQEYKKSKDVRGTQFVFLDIGINSEGKRYHFNLYDDMISKLVNAGIPRNEIAKIGDYNDEESRQILYNKMNNGDIRVLIGSTVKMGEGVNAQQRAVALHDVSVPWRPDNLEQRHGRIVRSGNINKNVRIYRYVQEGSYDSYLWQMIERKAAYLSEAYNGGDATDMDELNDAMVSYRESKAIATGNPLIMEKMSLQDKISRLKILQRGWQKEKLDAQKTIDQYTLWKRSSESDMKTAKADAETYQDEKQKSGGEFRITIGKKTFDNRKDATDELAPILEKKKVGKIGSLYGFNFGLMYDPEKNAYYLYSARRLRYKNTLGDSPAGNLTRILNLVENAPNNTYEDSKRIVDRFNAGIEDAKITLEAPFKHQKELEESQARMRVIDAELGVSGNEEEVIGSTAETSDSRDASNFNGNTAPRHPENWTAERVGDKNKTPMSGPDIVEMIRHNFDIPISTGNIRSPQARAQYHRLPQSVRSKVANSIPDIAHELGHHLDNIFDIHNSISAEAKREIIDAMPESFKAQYKKAQLPGEGIAEFLRRYLQNSETAAMDYPKFTEQFMGLLDNKTRAAVDKLADEVNAFYSLSEQTGNWPVHNREDKGTDYREMGEKLKDMNTHFRTLFIDSMEPIKQMDAETGGKAYLFATNAAYAGNRAYAAITGDLYDLRGNKLGVGLQKALEGIRLNNKKEYTDFGMYLICRHGPERLAEGMRVFNDDAWDNTAWMQQTAAELEDKYPNFEEAADRLEEYQHELIQAYGVESGLYSQETIDEWMERWEHYVPFNRWFGDRDGKVKGQKQGFANQTGPYKKARGSGLDIINPVDNIMENTVRLITASIRNEVMQKITEAAEHMEGSGRWLEKVPMPLARKTWDGKGLKAKTLEEFEDYFAQAGKSFGQDEEDLIQRILDGAIDDLLVQYTRGKAHGDIVTVMKDGKPEYWKINDPDLLRSVTNMGPTRAGELLNYYGRVTRFITGNITGMNVVWSIASNMPRDIGTMFTFSRTKNIVKLLSGIGESYVNKLRGDKASELYKEFMAMGGNSTSAQTADKDMAKKARKALQKQKSDWLNPLEWVEFVSDMIESGPRYSYYKICRTKYNMTPEEAFYAAMEITVNFKRAGVLSKEINILVPFFNAGVQGVDRMARWLAAEDIPKEDRKAGRTRRIAAYLGASLAIAALSMVLNARTKKKQEDLEKLSNYTKNNYFVIQMKNGKYIAIPKPREIAIPISLFERIMEYFVSGNRNSFDDFWEYATDNLLPGVVSGVAQGDLNSAIGDLGFFGTLHYLVSNQDFLGRPIVSNALKNLEPKDQYNQTTSQLAKLIGQAFNLSPQQIDFLGNNMFGGFWQWQKALAPVSGKTDLSLGVASKWVKDPLYSTDVTNRMYNHRDALEKKKNSNPGDMQIAAEYRTVRDTATFYGRYYGLAKNEEETERSREVREAMLDLIMGVEENANNDRAYKFLMEVIEREGSTEYMPTVLDPVLKTERGQITLNSEEYFMLQTRYNSLYYNYIRLAMDNRPSMSGDEKTSTVEAAKKIAGIVARGEAIEAHGGTYEAYGKVKDLLEDGVEESDLINYLSARDLADTDGNGKTSNAELLLAAGGLKLPTVDTAKLISYNEPDLGLKLQAVGDYGVDATEYGKVLDALGDDNVTQANVQAAIDAVYGRTTNANRNEKAAMWQAMNKGWNPKNNPYSQNTGRKVQNALKLPTADDTPERPSSGLKLPTK